MSSASSGRYQSRLFNFVHQRSRRLTENLSRAFRHLQVATSRVAPVVLYPLYLLFQSTRSAGKQMHQAVQQSWPKLQADDTDSQTQTPLTADTPIQRVLLLVDALPLEEAVSTPSPDKTEPINFLAFLFKERFKFFLNSPKSTSSLTHSSLDAERSFSPTHNRPVVRGIATQLSSRTLVLVTAQNEILDILTPQQQEKLQERIIGEVVDYWRYQRLAHSVPYQALAFLDRTVADLESNHLAPVSKVAITALSNGFALGKRSWEIVQSPAIASDATNTHTFRIQALIWAAIDYFFGAKLPSAQLPSRHGSLPQQEFSRQLPPQFVSSDVDPWLTLTDLFGDPESSKDEPATQHMPESSTSQTMSQLGGKNRFQKLLSQTKQVSGLVSEDVCLVSAGEISNQPLRQSTQIEPAPDWIETDATAMGYVKHPLEQLLEWLDRAMLWLEELLMRAFQWVRSCMAR
jgi:hypothetical protein